MDRANEKRARLHSCDAVAHDELDVQLAARVIEPSVKVIPQRKPLWLRAISTADDVCFSLGIAHVLDLFLVGFLLTIAILLAIFLARYNTY